jgi:hypothetical protein
MTTILSIDPGMSTGIVLAEYDTLVPLTILGKWQIEGGLTGLIERFDPDDVDEVVAEKFSPLPRVFRLNELEPLRIEGALEAWYPVIHWQRPVAMALAGTGGSQAENKKAADDILRAAGLWTTGSQVGCKDANDVNSATKHLVSRMRRIGHGPTLSAVFHV